MRVFAVSDLHVDYPENLQWVKSISKSDYTNDVLILAGDVSDHLHLLAQTFESLSQSFRQVLFVPGNHDLWVHRCEHENSFDKLDAVKAIANNYGASMKPFHHNALSIVPLLSWYDYSFRPVDDYIRNVWMDFHACNWLDYDDAAMTNYFHRCNEPFLTVQNERVITFSHFMPRVDIMPWGMPEVHKRLFSVFGSKHLEDQLRLLNPFMHVYGHSHLNRYEQRDGVLYVNNAFGYPLEESISAKALRCIHEED